MNIHASATGLLRDISETGLRVAGIEVSVGQIKTFQVPIDTFMQTDPLLVVTKMQMGENKGQEPEIPCCGIRDIRLVREGQEKYQRVY